MPKRPTSTLESGAFDAYVDALRHHLSAGDSTEHTHRPALKTFLERIVPELTATNEPKRIAVGAPDFSLRIRSVPAGHIETKDVGTALDNMVKGKGPSAEQFARYNKGLPNWVLTDYLTFRWFVDGRERAAVTIGSYKQDRLSIIRDAEAQLAALIKAFVQHRAPVINTALDLAERLAGMARILDDLVARTFSAELKTDYLHRWFDAIKATLISALTAEDFSDLFSQTVVYGLFAAKLAAGQQPFNRAAAAFLLPATNPFLRRFFADVAGVNMPSTLDWIVDDIVAVIDRINVPRVMRDFAKSAVHADPVVHFYETFLARYKPELRELRGVYYTPEPVVRYIVRSVDHILRTSLDHADGIASKDALVLDPAVGTATFLFVLIDELYSKLKDKRPWQKYVRDSLLPRVFGFELLMAPYAMAHLKLTVELQNTGYSFRPNERLGVYLTNSLEEAATKSNSLLAKYISDEAIASDEIKNNKPLLVVLGNPPYSGVSANRGKWIECLLESYRRVDGKPLGERKVWLKNDYVKFIRFAQWRVERSGHGVVAFITDNSYLDSPTFRGMRQSLTKAFDEIHILNLHGSTKRRETSPDGSRDENVFDIMQGVSIVFLVRKAHAGSRAATVQYSDLYGTREHKYETLLRDTIQSTRFEMLTSKTPWYYFVPVDTTAHAVYMSGISVKDCFSTSSNGIQTSRDHLVVNFDVPGLEERLSPFGDAALNDKRVRRELFGDKRVASYLPGDSREFKVPQARVAFQADSTWKRKVRPYAYRPFDERVIFYTDYMIDWPRPELAQALSIPGNIAMCIGRAGLVKSGEWTLCYVATGLIDHNIFYRGSSQNFPLYRLPEDDLLSNRRLQPIANFKASFTTSVQRATGLKYELAGDADLIQTFCPLDLFNYIYAVLNSAAYRARYKEFLDRDYPRIPIPASGEVFAGMSRLGARLIDLHLLRSAEADGSHIAYPKSGSDVVERIRFDDEEERLFINDTQYFQRLSAAAWDFEIGGYQVLNKWLKDRSGLELSYDDIARYARIVESIELSFDVVVQIDAILEPEFRKR